MPVYVFQGLSTKCNYNFYKKAIAPASTDYSLSNARGKAHHTTFWSAPQLMSQLTMLFLPTVQFLKDF